MWQTDGYSRETVSKRRHASFHESRLHGFPFTQRSQPQRRNRQAAVSATSYTPDLHAKKMR
jgi:hypothetical protein